MSSLEKLLQSQMTHDNTHLTISVIIGDGPGTICLDISRCLTTAWSTKTAIDGYFRQKDH